MGHVENAPLNQAASVAMGQASLAVSQDLAVGQAILDHPAQCGDPFASGFPMETGLREEGPRGAPPNPMAVPGAAPNSSASTLTMPAFASILGSLTTYREALAVAACVLPPGDPMQRRLNEAAENACHLSSTLAEFVIAHRRP